jgi:hypothetical protein
MDGSVVPLESGVPTLFVVPPMSGHLYSAARQLNREDLL